MMETTRPNDNNSSKRKLVEMIGSNKKMKDDQPKEDAMRQKVEWHDSLDMKYLGGDYFLTVNHFLGQTRVHVRKYVADKDGKFQATKDGVSLSPKVWHAFCKEVKSVLHPSYPDKMIIIERDLCISKQMKDDVQVFVFQRLFQRKNMSLQFVPEHLVLRGPELEKLIDNMAAITDRLKDGLITYTLAYYISAELSNTSLELKPVDNRDAFLELLVSLRQCLTVAITIKITELIDCFGCRESYQVNFMHDCLNKSRSEKWKKYFDQALYSINMSDIAKDIITKNLNIDYNYVLGQEEFFDAINVPKIFEAMEKMYISGKESDSDSEDSILC